MSLFVMEKFNLPAGYVGLVFLGLALSYSLSSPLLGVVSDKMPTLRKWLMVIGGLSSAAGFCLLGPAPFFNIKSENGFEEGLSTLGLVSGMFGAVWSCGLDNISNGTVFTLMCFITRSIDAVGFAATLPSSFAVIGRFQYIGELQ
ncbi:MFS-type transporter SLC18B1 [Acipenser ruthenus]|uniref:MFS-type transporter SLC18B1 n=1 Tax=Acipenser ruthenus TaxID=7906 RepID=A0A662YUK3_ACIRT|nr:MFS-type transporter SLC18B1 [Acipenser ruthenus]